MRNGVNRGSSLTDSGLTRRRLLGWLGALVPARILAAFPESPGSASRDQTAAVLAGFPRTSIFQTRYRADATILFCGLPLFSRSNVGSGFASVEISETAKGRAIALQFAAGSDPVRAHGLRRWGVLRESFAERAGSSEAAFSGVLTASQEESFDQAQKALNRTAAETPGVLTHGNIRGKAMLAWVDHVTLPEEGDWEKHAQSLPDLLRRHSCGLPRELEVEDQATFLHTMREARLRPGDRNRLAFVHGGKSYWLEIRRHGPSELLGVIRDADGRRSAEFRTAYAAGDLIGIPQRIEYQAKSYLRLVFEAEPHATQSIPTLFPEDAI